MIKVKSRQRTQFPLTGAISPMASAVVLVTTGMIHTERHMMVFARVDAFVMRPVCVTTSKVAKLMASMEKSVAWTESWPNQPLKEQAELGNSSLSRT